MLNQCKDAYLKGQAYRVLYPLTKGMIKIRELDDWASQLPDLLQRYGAYSSASAKNKGFLSPPNSPCMAYEACWWTRKLPADLCQELANRVYHAVTKLEADGLPPNVVDDLVYWLDWKIPTFLEFAESARLDSKRPWKYRARELANRQGQLYELTLRLIYIIGRVRTEAKI